MLMPRPFAMTPKATEYLRSRLQDPEPGRRPHLVRGFGYADGLSDVVYYEGEHFQLVYEGNTDSPTEHVELFGREVAIARGSPVSFPAASVWFWFRHNGQ